MSESREMRLRLMILERYESLRQAAIAADIPYSSLLTLLARGVSGAGFDTVMRLCRALEIDPREI